MRRPVLKPRLAGRPPGGYPARYGRFAGGIVAGETKEPVPAWHGEATLRLVDAGALLEAPFADGKGTALVGGRYSYTAALLSAIQSSIDLRYWDYQGRVTYELTPRDRVSVLALGAYDYLGEKQKDADTRILFDTTFHRLDLRYEHRFGPDTSVRQAVTLGFDQTRLDEGRFASEVQERRFRQILDGTADPVLFERALAISEGKTLMPKVQMAARYHCNKGEKELYIKRLNEVLESGDLDPYQRLANTIAKRKAARLLNPERMRQTCGF